MKMSDDGAAERHAENALRARVKELEEKLLVEEGRTLTLRDAIEDALRFVEMRPIGRALLSAALDATQEGGE